MSWMKRPSTAAAAGSEPPGNGAPQAYVNDQSMYPNYQQSNTQGNLPQQQQYWGVQQSQPQQPPAFNQMYGQVYQQDPNYVQNNANHMYQQYNQNYSNQTYNTPQTGYQQNYYQNQSVQQNYNQAPPTNTKQDGWEDNWDWGWEESAKQAQLSQQQQAAPPLAPSHQTQQSYNNANVIEESFASNDTWSWATDDKKDVQASMPSQNQPPPQPVPMQPSQISVSSNQTTSATELSIERCSSNFSNNSATEEVRTLNDKELVQECLPNLAIGKRFHLENLTPQWSIESQMSQESSDGVQTQSESASYPNETLSRNSNASPTNVDHFNSQLDLEESSNADWSKHSTEEETVRDTNNIYLPHEGPEEIANSLQEMSINSRETLSRSSLHSTHSNHDELNNAPQNVMPSPSYQPSHAPSLLAPPHAASSALPPLPPTNFPSGSNPFKNTGSFSHKTTSKTPTSIPSTNQFPSMSRDAPSPSKNLNLSSPDLVNMSQLNRPPAGFGANLETTPDNSERPDQPQTSPFRPLPTPPQIPDNMEVAPQNDRNEYLQTAHLSSEDYSENAEYSRGAPPPGLRRLVVGEAECGAGPGPAADEPPPGLARMVPGQHTEEYWERRVDGARGYRQAEGRQAEGRQAGGRRVGPGLERDGDGSDYTEHTPRALPRPVAAAAAAAAPSAADPDDDRREVTMEGENLQDLSIISSAELAYSRDQTLDGADLTVSEGVDRKTDASDSLEIPALGSRRQSFNRTSEEDSERDRLSKRERDKHKSNRDRDRERERDGRYSREEKKKDRDGNRRRSEKERDRGDRRERDGSGEERRTRRHARYDTEDTDYCSDRERERRRYREGSYASKPPRHDDKDRRYRDDRDRNRRYNTIERDRRYDDERDGTSHSRRSDRDRDRNRYERKYRDIDPDRKYGSLRRDEDDRRRGGGGGGGEGSEREGTDEGGAGGGGGRHDRHRRHRRSRHHDAHYDPSYASAYSRSDPLDGYEAQRRQYSYYERLRRTDPAAYLLLYRQLVAGEQPAPYPDLYGAGVGYSPRADDSRGSVHSGRSSAGLGNTTYSEYVRYSAGVAGVAGGRGRATPLDLRSLRTDLSDRDFNTDASLNLQLEESTRSERMTPFKYSGAHIKCNISQGDMVVVSGARARVLSLGAALRPDRALAHLDTYLGPLYKGVTHKKSVIEYCRQKARSAGGAPDPLGYVLIWDLLALLLTQNGMVMGADIAELLMQNTRDYEYKPTDDKITRTESEVGSRSRSRSVAGSGAGSPSPSPTPRYTHRQILSESVPAPAPAPCVEPAEALERLRELLLAGDRNQAIEWAMDRELWSHALYLSGWGGARARAGVLQRYVRAVPAPDPLRSLYAALAGAPPPAATCVSDDRWGDWRPHAAILLANSGARPELDYRTMVQFGDSLAARGLIFAAQFCYLSCGVQFARHPLAPLAPCPSPSPSSPALAPSSLAPSLAASPPRLSLLLADPRARSLAAFATNEAIIATEIYEYAMSLNQDYVIDEFMVYKYLLCCRLADGGQYARALACCETLARRVAERAAPAALVARLAALADRLQYHEPMIETPCPAEGAAGESPRRAWHQELQHLAHALQSEQNSPSHAAAPAPAAPPPAPAPVLMYEHQQWTEQHQLAPEPPALYNYSQYGTEPLQQHNVMQQAPVSEPGPAPALAPADDWYPGDEHAASPYDNYWQGDNSYQYNETERPHITMPGAGPAPGLGPAPAGPALCRDYDDEPARTNNESDSVSTNDSKAAKKEESKSKEGEGGKGGAKSGWLGGILTKLSLRPPNQMILPDDKNPSIVWDAEHKRWRNVGGEGSSGGEGDPAPPPRVPLAPSTAAAAAGLPNQSSGAAPPPPGAPVANIFKMQKSRHIKKSYVDVLNPGGAASPGPAPAPAPPPAAPPAYFVPPGSHYQVIDIPSSSPAHRARSPSPSLCPSPSPVPSATTDHSEGSTSEFHSEQHLASSTDESQSPWTQ